MTNFLKTILSGERPQDVALQPPYARWEWIFLGLLLLVGFNARVVIAALFPSVYHPDETFQYWEQAYRLTFGYGMVPWEYRVGIRSYLVPGALAAIMQAVDYFGGGLAAWRLAIQAALSLLSLTIIATSYAWARRAGGRGAAFLAGIITCTWFELVYFSPKPLTEVIAASLLFPAAYLLCLRHSKEVARAALGGVLVGLAFLVRFQLAPALAIIALACLVTGGWRRALPAAIGALVTIIAGGVLDWVTLGQPFQSIWLNFVVNAVQDKASGFGVQPFFWYLLFYFNAWAGFFVPLVFAAAFGVRRAPLLLIVALTIVVAHSFIGHKEYRFVYPALPFILTLASIGAVRLSERFSHGRSQSIAVTSGLTVLAALWVVTSINLAAQDGFRGNFIKKSEAIEALEIASGVEGICGLGLTGLSWVDSAGYSSLGIGPPVYQVQNAADGAILKSAFNVVVETDSSWSHQDEAFERIGCAGSLCAAKRQGSCTPQIDKTVNEYLIRTGQ